MGDATLDTIAAIGQTTNTYVRIDIGISSMTVQECQVSVKVTAFANSSVTLDSTLIVTLVDCSNA